MASINLTGILRDPLGEVSYGNKIRFTHTTTTGETVSGFRSIETIVIDGEYDIDLQYGNVVVETLDKLNRRWINHGTITINSDTPATSIPALLGITTPATDEDLLVFQSLVADAESAKDDAQTAKEETEAIFSESSDFDLYRVANSLNVTYSSVIRSTDTTTPLTDVLYIYDATTQTTYTKPDSVTVGDTIDSISGRLLTTTTGSFYMPNAIRSGELVSINHFVSDSETVTQSFQRGYNYAVENNLTIDIPTDIEVTGITAFNVDPEYITGNGIVKSDTGDFLYVGTNKKPYVILALGQSNMAGSILGRTDVLETNDKVFMWNTDTNVIADMQFGDNFYIGEYGTAPLNVGNYLNDGEYTPILPYSAARAIQEKTGRPVFVVLIASGGHAIESFIPPDYLTAYGWALHGANQDLTQFMYPYAVTALHKVPGVPTTYDAVMWNQGEANNSDGVEEYARKFDVMMKRLFTSGCIESDTPIIAAELAQNGANISSRARHLTSLKRLTIEDQEKSLRVVRTNGLVSAIDDNYHYSSESYIELGKRYADAALSGIASTVYDIDTNSLDTSTDAGLSNLTLMHKVGNIAQRVPVAITQTFSEYVADTPIGRANYTTDNSILLTTRSFIPAPSINEKICVNYSVSVDGTGTMTHRAVIAQFDKDFNFISSIVSPSIATVSTDGAVKNSVTFGVAGSGADRELIDSTAEYIAIGINTNTTNETVSYYWRIDSARFV